MARAPVTNNNAFTSGGIIVADDAAAHVKTGAAADISAALDTLFGSTEGQILQRGATAWQALNPGTVNQVLESGGAAALNSWIGLSALLDAVFGSTEGQILQRGVSAWQVLAPGTSGQLLQSGGAAALNAWTSALANGTTASTQAAGDNTTKVATDAFVHTEVANAIAGVNPAVAVQAATTAAADTSGFTYTHVAGIGDTLTGPTANVAVTIDGFTFTALGQRLLVKNDTQAPSGAFNGVYYVTTLQAPLVKPVLTRALDYDTPSDINNTGAIPVVNGTVNALTSWLLTSTVNTVGTDPLTYSQFSVSPTTIVPVSLGGSGANLSATGGTSQVVKQVSAGANFTVGQLAAADLSNYATGTWTPVDASGASLTFSNVDAGWTRIGNMIFAYCSLLYPVTADGSTAKVGGLPFTAANRDAARAFSSILGPVTSHALEIVVIKNTTTFNVYDGGTGAFLLNSAFSGSACDATIVYPLA